MGHILLSMRDPSLSPSFNQGVTARTFLNQPPIPLTRHENKPPNSQGPVTVQIGVEQLNIYKFHGSGVEQLVEMVLPTEFRLSKQISCIFPGVKQIFPTCGERSAPSKWNPLFGDCFSNCRNGMWSFRLKLAMVFFTAINTPANQLDPSTHSRPSTFGTCHCSRPSPAMRGWQQQPSGSSVAGGWSQT